MASLSALEQEELAYEDNTPTPAGWRRKLIPHIGKGLIPARIEVVFVAPSGDEFKSKAKLQRYLKVNRGSPSFSEFIWDTDETPRRSSRSASKRSRSPPKTISRKKPAREVPHEEAKANKHSHPVQQKARSEDKKRDNKKSNKVTLTISQEDTNGKVSPRKGSTDVTSGLSKVPALSKAKEGEKKPKRDTKKRKGVKAATQSDEISGDIAEIITDAQTSKGQQENRKDEKSVEENGKEDSLEQLLSPKGNPSNSESMPTEEAHNDKEAKDFCDDADNGGPKDAENYDRTTTSLPGLDGTADDMEENSDTLDSEEKSVVDEGEGDTAQEGEQGKASDI